MQIEHRLRADLITARALRILVVGAGGTGSAIAMALPYLNQAMQAWGHPAGLEVVLMDADVVSPINCIRQPFAATDIGQNKAVVLINRINLFWGTSWGAVPENFQERSFTSSDEWRPHILISCVDTKAARKAIHTSLSGPLSWTSYWLDLGNNAASGQFILGQPLNRRNLRSATRLRTVSELYPEVIDLETGEDTSPSCSAIEALDRQEPFVNQALAYGALSMLTRLLRHGTLSHHGAFFNAATGRMSALPIDPDLWRKTRRRCRRSAKR